MRSGAPPGSPIPLRPRTSAHQLALATEDADWTSSATANESVKDISAADGQQQGEVDVPGRSDSDHDCHFSGEAIPSAVSPTRHERSGLLLLLQRAPMAANGRSSAKARTCDRARHAARFVRVSVTHGLVCLAAALCLMVWYWALFPLCTVCLRTSPPRAPVQAGETGRSTLYINELQVIGTHNSYHRRSRVPGARRFWGYHFPPLTTQLDAGVRHLELDIHYDWKTGRWFVFHVSVLDAFSTCSCLAVCLGEIKQWSDAHPAHHILFIEIELKIFGDFLAICGPRTPETDQTAFLVMQETVAEVFPRDRILTPRDVKGDYATLTEAVRNTSAARRLTRSAVRRARAEDPPEAVPVSDIADAELEPAANSSSGSSHTRSGGYSSNLEGGAGDGTKKGGGWPLVDETRGMVLFVVDYQSHNVACRSAVRKALPEEQTLFFERTSLQKWEDTPFLAFTEAQSWRRSTKIRRMVDAGVIVRERLSSRDWAREATTAEASRASHDDHHDELGPTYLVNSPAQLLVTDDLRPLERLDEVASGGGSRRRAPVREQTDVPPLQCRSGCSATVPRDDCILEGFC